MINSYDRAQWFKDYLKDLMDYNEVTVSDISKHCEISAQRFNNYLYGRTLPQLWTLVMIADFLETTTNELLDFDEADDDVLLSYDPYTLFEDEEEFTAHVRNRIKQYMIDNNIDIFYLSEETGFTRLTIRRWLGLSGNRKDLPRTSDFIVICDTLGCTPSDLLGY